VSEWPGLWTGGRGEINRLLEHGSALESQQRLCYI
jgi:hypothetical protein